MAALVLSILPIIVVYLFFNKKIIQGMTAGAVKG
jgi:raffinose/stachyose/melibiose transport system permease protein